jgi:oligopeptidase B
VVPPLFKINMAAGHGGSSGRYDALRELAFDYTWILGVLGLGPAGAAPRPRGAES